MTEIRRELNISTEAHFVRMHAYRWLCCAVHLPCEHCSWQDIMTSCRATPQQTVLETVMNDAEITAIREGAPLPMDTTYRQPMPETPTTRR